MATNGYDMTLKYKELEQLARVEKTKWEPEGTPNLYAVARGNKSVFWIVRVSNQGRRVVITLGRWPDMKAETARLLAPTVKALVKSGFGEDAIKNGLILTHDPLKLLPIVQGEKVANTGTTPDFEAVARDWYDHHLKGGLSDGPYKRQVIQQLNDHIFPSLGSRPINEIKRGEIINALRDIWLDKKPTGVKLRGNIERIFDYAIDLELREGNPTPKPRSLPISQHQVEHFKSMQYERAPELWQWLHTRPRMGPQTRIGLSLALLLGKRTLELRKMRWADVDLENGIWVTPAEHMKKRKAHRQPLPSQALELLQFIHKLTGHASLVLGNQHDKPLSENAMLYALKRFDDVTPHGFRATLGSWCAEQGVRKVVSDFLKAHQPKYLDAAYQRSDLLEERREVLQRWADFVTVGKL